MTDPPSRNSGTSISAGQLADPTSSATDRNIASTPLLRTVIRPAHFQLVFPAAMDSPEELRLTVLIPLLAENDQVASLQTLQKPGPQGGQPAQPHDSPTPQQPPQAGQAIGLQYPSEALAAVSPESPKQQAASEGGQPNETPSKESKLPSAIPPIVGGTPIAQPLPPQILLQVGRVGPPEPPTYQESSPIGLYSLPQTSAQQKPIVYGIQPRDAIVQGLECVRQGQLFSAQAFKDNFQTLMAAYHDGRLVSHTVELKDCTVILLMDRGTKPRLGKHHVLGKVTLRHFRLVQRYIYSKKMSELNSSYGLRHTALLSQLAAADDPAKMQLCIAAAKSTLHNTLFDTDRVDSWCHVWYNIEWTRNIMKQDIELDLTCHLMRNWKYYKKAWDASGEDRKKWKKLYGWHKNSICERAFETQARWWSSGLESKILECELGLAQEPFGYTPPDTEVRSPCEEATFVHL